MSQRIRRAIPPPPNHIIYACALSSAGLFYLFFNVALNDKFFFFSGRNPWHKFSGADQRGACTPSLRPEAPAIFLEQEFCRFSTVERFAFLPPSPSRIITPPRPPFLISWIRPWFLVQMYKHHGASTANEMHSRESYSFLKFSNSLCQLSKCIVATPKNDFGKLWAGVVDQIHVYE